MSTSIGARSPTGVAGATTTTAAASTTCALSTPRRRRPSSTAAGPCRAPRTLPTEPAIDNQRPVEHHMTGTVTEGYGADWFGIAPHGYATSHLDALCHIFWDGQVYGGRPADVVTAHGATKLGVDTLRDGIVARGVLLDVPATLGLDALEPGTTITVEDLEAAEARADVRVGTGDVLLVRTGRWRWREQHGPWDPREQLAGLHASCLPWLHRARSRCSAATACPMSTRRTSPTCASRSTPSASWRWASTSSTTSTSMRSPTPAVRRSDAAFLLAVAPLILHGGTASPVNPIATL